MPGLCSATIKAVTLLNHRDGFVGKDAVMPAEWFVPGTHLTAGVEK